MSETKLVRRGKRRPTSAWIVKSKTKTGTAYRVRWIDPTTAQTLSQSCGRDAAVARRTRDTKRIELRDMLTGRLPGKTLGELIDNIGIFLAGRSKHTVRKTKDSLLKLKELCGERLLEHVGRDVVMEFRSKRLDNGCCIATANKDIRQIRSSLSYAQDAGWIRFNPLLRWKNARLTEPEKMIRVVEQEEFAKLLAVEVDPVFRVILIVAYYQGLRRTELANLRWNAVDLQRGGLHVLNVPEANEFTKSRKNRTLPMHPIVRRELTALRADAPKVVREGRQETKYPHVFVWKETGKPFLSDWITHKFSATAKAAGVKATIHDLRRSFSTLAQRAGVDRNVLKDLGGWSSVSVLEKHYLGTIEPALERAMEIIARATVTA